MTLLSCENLTVSINNKFICENLNLQISAGECWGLLGANGSGKTTLLKTFAGLHSQSSGNIFIKEKNIKSMSRKEIALQLGMLFQHQENNFEQTVAEYCLLGRHPHISKFNSETQHDLSLRDSALKTMELNHLAKRKLSTLSGGERRRLALAMLLTQAPHIYLLDEPTNHLDFYHQIKVLEFFKRISHAGICMALHDVRLAWHFCEKSILLFPDGEILFGDTKKLFNEENLCRLYRLSKDGFTVLNFSPLQKSEISHNIHR